MASAKTIAGVSVEFGLPEYDTRILNRSLGQAQDKTWKFVKHGSSDKPFKLSFHGLTTAKKEELLDALEADANYQVAIHPDDHIDLGNGAGVEVVAQWLDDVPNFVKENHDFWNGELNFMYVS